VTAVAYDMGERPRGERPINRVCCLNCGDCECPRITYGRPSIYAETHDDAQALIRYAVPGAHVTFWRPATGSDRTRAYQITMRRWGRADVAVQGAYTVPAPAEQIARNAVEQADRVARG
jgi:hypothetical protein